MPSEKSRYIQYKSQKIKLHICQYVITIFIIELTNERTVKTFKRQSHTGHKNK